MSSVEYKFQRQEGHEKVPARRNLLVIFLTAFQVLFVLLLAFFAKYKSAEKVDANLYAMFMDVHSMMFVGFGFLMTFLKRYGFGSLTFNLVVASFVLEWALIVRGFIGSHFSVFHIDLENLLVADFCAAAVLISLGAVLGKTSLVQLIIMAAFEVVIQSINEHIGVDYFKAVDIGESIYVHVFGAYFGLAVAKVLNHKKVHNSRESSVYHSDLFSMIGTLFLWLYWPSFNSAVAKDEGQTRAIVNTLLSIVGSTITTVICSTLLGRKRLNMVHIQNATLAGGVAVGAVADQCIQPFGALIIGSIAGFIATFGFEYITPLLKRFYLHDTCGVNNLHGLPGIFSGLASAVFARCASADLYGGERNLYKFYPAREPTFNTTVSGNPLVIEPGRSANAQAGFQLAALGLTIGMAVVGGILTGFVMKIPLFEQIKDEAMFDDDLAFITPDDYSFKLLAQVQTRRPADEDEDQSRSVRHHLIPQ